MEERGRRRGRLAAATTGTCDSAAIHAYKIRWGDGAAGLDGGGAAGGCRGCVSKHAEAIQRGGWWSRQPFEIYVA
jgi:hypothetical protein